MMGVRRKKGRKGEGEKVRVKGEGRDGKAKMEGRSVIYSGGEQKSEDLTYHICVSSERYDLTCSLEDVIAE